MRSHTASNSYIDNVLLPSSLGFGSSLMVLIPAAPPAHFPLSLPTSTASNVHVAHVKNPRESSEAFRLVTCCNFESNASFGFQATLIISMPLKASLLVPLSGRHPASCCVPRNSTCYLHQHQRMAGTLIRTKTFKLRHYHLLEGSPQGNS